MKNTYKIILISCLIISQISCKKILIENPVSLATADGYYSTAKGIEDGLKAAYPPLRSFYGPEQGFLLTVVGTDIYTKGIGGVINFSQFNDYSANLLGSDRMLTIVWDQFYIGINQCNTIEARTPVVEDLTEDQKARIIGEARFLRAFYYFHLVQQFGDIHFTLEETIGVQTEATRTPVSTIYEEGILPDLQYAIENLPPSAAEYGRATKATAEALLARVQLVLGNWTEAERLATNVINNYGFSLVKPYVALWDIENDVKDEIIWSVQYSGDPQINGNGNMGHLYFNPRYTLNKTIEGTLEYGRIFARFMPTNNLIKTFDQAIDSRWEGSFRTVWIANKAGKINGHAVSPGDTAIKMVTYPVHDAIQKSLPYSLYDFNDTWVGKAGDLEIGSGKRALFPGLLKYADPLRISFTATDGRKDFPVIRLAEMYLIAAEAAWRQGRNEDAATFINVIRARAAIPGKEAEMQVEATDINLDFILDERARELAGEMHRWYDLKRTGKLLERVRKYNLDAAPNIQEMHLVRPIPQTQIDRVSNPQDFPQNPGY